MELPKLYTPQPTVEIEVFRPAQMYLDRPAASETYHIHLDFLRYYSVLFRTQYDDALRYTKIPKLRVSYPELTSLGRFIEYTYSQEIDTTNLNHQDFIFLWIFAEQIGAVQLQNYAITCLEDFRRENPSQFKPDEMSKFLDERTTSESPLRRYLWEASTSDLATDLDGSKKKKYRIRRYFVGVKEGEIPADLVSDLVVGKKEEEKVRDDGVDEKKVAETSPGPYAHLYTPWDMVGVVTAETKARDEAAYYGSVMSRWD